MPTLYTSPDVNRERDLFIGNPEVTRLHESTFCPLVSRNDVVLVMFYDPRNESSKDAKNYFLDAIRTNRIRNAVFGAVNCFTNKQLCISQEVWTTLDSPIFKMYSRGEVMEEKNYDFRTFNADSLGSMLDVPRPIRTSTPTIKYKLSFELGRCAVYMLNIAGEIGGSLERNISQDFFVNDPLITRLNATTYCPFVNRNDIVMVMFYDPRQEDNREAKKEFIEAANMTSRQNSSFAAVNCAREGGLCHDVKIMPTFKLFSRGQLLNVVEYDQFSTTASELYLMIEELPELKPPAISPKRR